MDLLKSVLNVLAWISFACLILWIGSCASQADLDQREQQRADCIKSGGKYAESQSRLNVSRDFCIK